MRLDDLLFLILPLDKKVCQWKTWFWFINDVLQKYYLYNIWCLGIFMYSCVCESTIISFTPGIAFIYYHAWSLMPNQPLSVLFIFVFSESNFLATSSDNTTKTGCSGFKSKLNWKFINQILTQMQSSQWLCFSFILFCFCLLNLKRTVHMLICDYEC